MLLDKFVGREGGVRDEVAVCGREWYCPDVDGISVSVEGNNLFIQSGISGLVGWVVSFFLLANLTLFMNVSYRNNY